MSDSIQSQVMDAAVAALGGEAGSAFRCRFTPFAKEQLPAENVLPEDEHAQYETTDDEELEFRFLVRHMAAAVDQVDKAVDARYVRGRQLLQSDPTLGGLVRRIRYVSRKWEFEKGEFDSVALVVTYQVEFSTKRSDPTVPGF